MMIDIARESKALNEPAPESAELAAMSRRLQVLEGKLEQILETLPKGSC